MLDYVCAFSLSGSGPAAACMMIVLLSGACKPHASQKTCLDDIDPVAVRNTKRWSISSICMDLLAFLQMPLSACH